MRWKTNVTVAAVVQRDGRFLLVEENIQGRRVFNQPAGHLEKNESLADAVRREVLEETAWEFQPEALIGTYLYPGPQAEITYLRFCFAGSCRRHHPERALDENIIQVHWLTRAELEAKREQLRSPVVLQCVEDFLLGHRYPLAILRPHPPPPAAV